MDPEYPPPSWSVPEPVVPDTAPDTAPPAVVEPEPGPAAPEPEQAAEPTGGTYRFLYGYPTTYPELGLTFEPGDLHDWPDGPPTDGRWTPATPKE